MEPPPVESTSLPELGNPDLDQRLKLNDRRAVVVGHGRACLGFQAATR